MPSRRQPLIDLSKPQGLSLTGPSTGTSLQFLQRAKGLHEICEREYRIAPNDSPIEAHGGIHSITRFLDVRIYAAGPGVYAVGTGLFFINLTTDYLTFLRLPPGNTQQDQLFWAGGSYTRKANAAAGVTKWGIDPPPDGFTVALATQLVKTIENFEGAGWTITGTGDVANITQSNDGTINQDGNSLKVAVPVDTLDILTEGNTVDLSKFTTAGDSSNQDFIELWIRVDGDTTGFDYFTLRFDVGGGDFSSDYYQFKFLPTSVTINTMSLAGAGASSTVSGDEVAAVETGGGDADGGGTVDSPDTGTDATADLGDDTDVGGNDSVSTSSATWSRLRVPKSQFLRSGNGSGTWANVVAMQLMIKTNSLAGV